MLQETDQPLLADRIEEASEIRVKNIVHLCAVDSGDECVQRIVLAALAPEPVREAESRSAPRMPPAGQSCLRVRQLRAGAAGHRPSVCNVAETAEPDMLPGGPERAGPRSCDRGVPVCPV